MHLSSLIWLLLLGVVGWTHATPIVGGHFVQGQDQQLDVAKYPYMASLQDRLVRRTDANFLGNETLTLPVPPPVLVEYRHFCGGSLLSATYILTAAHCVWRKNLADVVAVIGIEDISKVAESERYALNRAEYVSFQSASYQNDIALLRLETPLPQKQYPAETYAQLPRPGMKVNRRNACRIMGYGATHYGGNVQTQLIEGEVHVIKYTECRRALGMFAPQRHENTICALGQNQDTCQGDSGGPLICRYAGVDYITGIVSHGPTCGISGIPSIYTVVIPFLDWIQTTLRDL